MRIRKKNNTVILILHSVGGVLRVLLLAVWMMPCGQGVCSGSIRGVAHWRSMWRRRSSSSSAE
jgi:hypothetical protein